MLRSPPKPPNPSAFLFPYPIEVLSPHPNPNRNPSMNRPNNRDDCWSDGATQTLIEAWGDRYVQLNRGNLRQTDWKEIAISVNARQSGVKPHKTDVQCKNRIDTLKKKYKVEKSKPAPSNWAFYHRLHSLIGATDAVNKKKPATTVTLTVKSSKTKPNDTSPIRWSAPVIDSDGSMECSHEMEFAVKRKQRFETVNFSEGAAFRELARAILKFGEIYERIESSKQEQMMELEKQRMEFTKELEFQRMNMFMDTQLEVQKRMKRPKYGKCTTSGKM